MFKLKSILRRPTIEEHSKDILGEKQEALLFIGQGEVISVWNVHREYTTACETSIPVLIFHGSSPVTYDLSSLVKLFAERLISVSDVTMGNVALLMHILSIGYQYGLSKPFPAIGIPKHTADHCSLWNCLSFMNDLVGVLSPLLCQINPTIFLVLEGAVLQTST